MPNLTVNMLEAIRAAWGLYDAARDRNDYDLARQIRAGLDRRADSLGMGSADDLANL